MKRERADGMCVSPWYLLTWPCTSLIFHICHYEDSTRTRRFSQHQGSFCSLILSQIKTRLLRPLYFAFCIEDTVGVLFPICSELWMTTIIDHLVCEWHLNMLKVIWSHISRHVNISRSWNSLIGSPPAPVIVEVHQTSFTKRYYSSWPKRKFPVSNFL